MPRRRHASSNVSPYSTRDRSTPSAANGASSAASESRSVPSRSKIGTVKSRFARRQHRRARRAAAELAAARVFVPARVAGEAHAGVEGERRDVEAIDLVGAAEGALQVATLLAHHHAPFTVR